MVSHSPFEFQNGSQTWGALHKIGRFQNVPTVRTNLGEWDVSIPPKRPILPNLYLLGCVV